MIIKLTIFTKRWLAFEVVSCTCSISDQSAHKLKKQTNSYLVELEMLSAWHLFHRIVLHTPTKQFYGLKLSVLSILTCSVFSFLFEKSKQIIVSMARINSLSTTANIWYPKTHNQISVRAFLVTQINYRKCRNFHWGLVFVGKLLHEN